LRWPYAGSLLANSSASSPARRYSGGAFNRGKRCRVHYCRVHYSAHVSSQRRDRHGRGLRGPLALPNALTARRAQPPHPANKADFFSDAVHDAVDRVGLQCPDALVGVTFGIEDVPHFDTAWSGDQVPLAAALEATADQPGQVVIYRRPLEHRAVSRRGLRILVYRTIVEQLSALTGRSVEEIDPDGAGAEDD